MKKDIFHLSDVIKKNIVRCIADGLGDDTKACYKHANLDLLKSNSKGTMKWDMVNRNLCNFDWGPDLTAAYAKRGAWNMTPLYDSKNGFLFTFMRQQRFKEISRLDWSNRKIHYMKALVEAFNYDLPNVLQLSLIDDLSSLDRNKEEINKIVESLLSNFCVTPEVVKRYALVLFDEFNGEISSVRCCILNTNLEIVEEENWSEFINYVESVVVDEMDDPVVDTMLNISLKDKALRKRDEKEHFDHNDIKQIDGDIEQEK